ncbi:MAG: hypothetical protein GTO41_20310, partial [Burkholderiales bacterium]|nr:hypothetical protein [Burkholderiales bacterium]
MAKASQSQIVAQFDIRYTRYLDAQGQVRSELPDVVHNEELLRQAYQTMVLTRRFDSKALNLQRTGQIGTYGSSLGQE